MNQNKKKGITTMKNKNLIMIAVSAVFLFSTLFGKEIHGTHSQHVARVAEGLENQSPSISVMNINNIAQWIMKDGAYTTSGSPNGQQGDYPIFTGGLIYADGMLWGAVVKDSLDVDGNPVQKTDTGVRVGGSTYGHGLAAGRVIYDAATGDVIGADDPSTNHVWRVRKDWETADKIRDGLNNLNIEIKDTKDGASWRYKK